MGIAMVLASAVVLVGYWITSKLARLAETRLEALESIATSLAALRAGLAPTKGERWLDESLQWISDGNDLGELEEDPPAQYLEDSPLPLLDTIVRELGRINHELMIIRAKMPND